MDREDKIEEILDAAKRVLRSGGYDALSFKQIADELGLARGALYWYFPSKDDLFVAAAASAFNDALSRPPVRAGYARRISWAVERLAELQPINIALHDRARHSDPAAQLEQTIQEQMCARLRDVLHPHVDPSRVDVVAQTIVVFVQGLLSLPLTPAERSRNLSFLLDELVR